MRELELYLHIPFCVRKCAYCDFLSAPATKEAQQSYVQSLLREIACFPQKEAYRVSTVFFGGGTPSVLPARWTAGILDALREQFLFVPEEELEITIECNPGTADRRQLETYLQAGINRISLGLQSSENEELAMLGRIHTWETFRETYEAARAAGFRNINVDLMSGLPGQTVSSWERTLRRTLALEPEHISAYSLIIEEGTPFYSRYHEDDERRVNGEAPRCLPSEEAEREMYRLTERLLGEAGMHRYEISNYARPGKECRHNIGYWTGVEYAGFGLGAASLLDHVRYQNTEQMDLYLQKYADRSGLPEKGGTSFWHVNQTAEVLTPQDEMAEFMFLGLRMTGGISEREFARRFGQTVVSVYGEALAKHEQEGLLIRENGRIRLSAAGLDLSNYVMADFVLL